MIHNFLIAHGVIHMQKQMTAERLIVATVLLNASIIVSLTGPKSLFIKCYVTVLIIGFLYVSRRYVCCKCQRIMLHNQSLGMCRKHQISALMWWCRSMARHKILLWDTVPD